MMDNQRPVMPHVRRNINIGEIIKDKVDSQHWSYTKFAEAISCSRSSLYNIFAGRDISLLRFVRICEVLQCNLFTELFEPDDDDTVVEPMLVLPISGGRLTLDQLPPQIIELLSDSLDGVQNDDGNV